MELLGITFVAGMLWKFIKTLSMIQEHLGSLNYKLGKNSIQTWHKAYSYTHLKSS